MFTNLYVLLCWEWKQCTNMADTIINDPIHGTVAISPICVKIIDTPQFQRLRHITQTSMCSYVYPGATHTRFEHSIGVCYLAGQLARHLRDRMKDDIERLRKIVDPSTTQGMEQPPKKLKPSSDVVQTILEKQERHLGYLKTIEMTDRDLMCIEIAGLCHDLGHGPFSHLFDQIFYKEKKIIDDGNVPKDWKHEQASVDMLHYMVNIDVNPDLRDHFKKMLNVSDDNELQTILIFIENLIIGKQSGNKPHYMFEIVANKSSEIDVDKMDYFARDCYGLGIKSDFDHQRYIQNCRVMIVDNSDGGMRSAICVRDKAIHDLYEMFHTRNNIHRRAVYHKTSKGIEYMITEALVAANDFIELKTNPDGVSMKMSQAWKDMSAYMQLTDGIINYIAFVNDPDGKLSKSKELIKRIHNRDLYTCIYESSPKKASLLDTEKLAEHIKKKGKEVGIHVDDNDFLVKAITFSYGKNNDNPIKHVYFYRKNTDECFTKDDPSEVSHFVPRDVFQETIVRVYSKHTRKMEKRQQLQDIVIRCAKSWFDD